MSRRRHRLARQVTTMPPTSRSALTIRPTISSACQKAVDATGGGAKTMRRETRPTRYARKRTVSNRWSVEPCRAAAAFAGHRGAGRQAGCLPGGLEVGSHVEDVCLPDETAFGQGDGQARSDREVGAAQPGREVDAADVGTRLVTAAGLLFSGAGYLPSARSHPCSRPHSADEFNCDKASAASSVGRCSAGTARGSGEEPNSTMPQVERHD
jgi:hypothetical protein